MAEPIHRVPALLRKIRGDLARSFPALPLESAARHAEVITRPDSLEAARVSFTRAVTSDAWLGRLVTGEFEGRIVAPETRVLELEGRA